jgi:hypothetical protein
VILAPVAAGAVIPHNAAPESTGYGQMFHSAVASQTLEAELLADAPPLRGPEMPLCRLLAAEVFHAPGRAVFRDQPGREAWSCRPARDWGAAPAHEAVIRLSSYFASLGLPPRALIGICLPGDTEAVLALLAAERSGLTACLLPVGADRGTLAEVIETAGIQAVVTQAMVGEHRPAELLCTIAAGYFRLRFLMAFGPEIPDGVIDLDRVLSEHRDRVPMRPDSADVTPAGMVTLSRREGASRLLFRPYASLIAATASILGPAKIRPEHRILSLLAPDDLRGIAVGPVAALLSGALFEQHGIFDGAALLSALDDSRPTHLVAPGWMEPSLAKIELPSSLASIVLVHDAPVRFRANTELKGRIIDVLAFDEIALIAAARTPSGLFALSLDAASGDKAVADLLHIRVESDGTVFFSGPAALAGEVERGRLPDPADAASWRNSGFRADLFAGIIIGVS